MSFVKTILFTFCFLIILEIFLVNGQTYTSGGGQGTAFSGACLPSTRFQSPINLPLTAQLSRFRSLRFNNHKNIYPATLVNNRLTLTVTLNHGSELNVNGGGLPDISPNMFIFDHMEFHWPSEHIIGGQSYTLEAQLVYRNSLFDTLIQARGATNGLAIFAVLYHLSENENTALASIINSARLAFNIPPTSTTTDPENIAGGIRLFDFLPHSYCSFYRYIGTLTIPPCSANVIWTVFLDTLHVAQNQVNKLRTLPSLQSGGPFLAINSRPVQPSDDRPISFQPLLFCKVSGNTQLFSTSAWWLRAEFSVDAALYGPQGQDTDIFWNTPFGTCSGSMQSPINLPSSVQSSNYGQFKFEGYSTPSPGSVLNVGFALAVLLNSPSSITISNGGLLNTYVFEIIIFHWPSEHTINGVSYPLEAQIIHRNTKYANFAQARTHSDGILALSVLFHMSNQENLAINLILNSGRNALTTYGGLSPLITGLTLSDLLPSTHCSYYRYMGSETVPVCAESFLWNVFSDTLPITAAQVAQFRTLVTLPIFQNGGVLNFNSRPTKPDNGRLITYETLPTCTIASRFKINTIIPWVLRPFVFANRN